MTKPNLRSNLILTLMIGMLFSTACSKMKSSDSESTDTDKLVSDASHEDADRESQDANDSSEGEEDLAMAPSEIESDLSDTIARVNGRNIPKSEFTRQAFDTQRYHIDQGSVDPNSEDGQEQLLFLRRMVLGDMIDQVLIEQAAERMDLDASDQEVEERLADLIDEIGQETFDAQMEESELSREDLYEMERASLIGMKIREAVASDVPETAEFRRARHILCSDEDSCVEALKRIKSGESFEDIAAEVSVDTITAERGGDLDWFSPGMLLSTELEQAIFELEDRSLSGPIETDIGFHIIELIEVDPERELDEPQKHEMREKLLLEWLAEERKSADIEILVEDLKTPTESE